MNCDRLRELLFDHLDGLLGADEAEGARAHLVSCADCRRLQEEVRRNFGAMDAWEDEGLPEGSWDRLRARLAAGPRPEASHAPAVPGRRWARLAFPFAAGLATAAAALLVFTLTRDPPASPSPAPPSVAPSGAPASLAAEPAAPPPAGAPLLAAEADRPALRAGERPLRFDDYDHNVVRTFRLPGDVAPEKVMLIELQTKPVIEGEVK